jgi:hypothetical protein
MGHKMGDVVAVGGICKCYNSLVVVATKTSNGANEFADDALPIAWCWQCSVYTLDGCAVMPALITVPQQFSGGK